MQAMKLVRISEYVCINFFPLFWSEENIPKLCKSIFEFKFSITTTVFLCCGSNEINMGDPRYSKLADGTLMIENTVDSDVGVYECMAKSATGEVKSRAAKMHYQKTRGLFFVLCQFACLAT